jgi:ribosomal protein L37AE/L43A
MRGNVKGVDYKEMEMNNKYICPICGGDNIKTFISDGITIWLCYDCKDVIIPLCTPQIAEPRFLLVLDT